MIYFVFFVSCLFGLSFFNTVGSGSLNCIVFSNLQEVVDSFSLSIFGDDFFADSDENQSADLDSESSFSASCLSALRRHTPLMQVRVS